MQTYCAGLVLMSLILPLGHGPGATTPWDDKDPPLVKKITKIEIYILEKNPPDLSVQVTGEVPTGGYTHVKLIRVNHKTPPKDGIQEYRLVATPPDGPATQVISTVEASHVIENFTKNAPWIKGVRILGVGDGVKVRMLDK
jgi:hypothetical protein